MKNRRIFLKNASALALGALLLPACNTQQKNTDSKAKKDTLGTDTTAKTLNKKPLEKIGVQLYSVKDVIEKDLKGTLQQLANIGYKEIESYPGEKGHFFGLEPMEFKSMLNGMGLELISTHFGSGSKNGKAGSWRQASMLQNFDEFVGKAAEAGVKYMTCAWMDESLRKTKDDLKKTAELFNKTGESCKKAGMQFAYHNHDFEFKQVEDVVLYDFMIENTDPELVKWEMDIFWVIAGGKDPIEYLKKFPGRFPLYHVKDMDKQDQSKNIEVGLGTINFSEILNIAQDQNPGSHFFIEQENFDHPVMESMKMNFDNLSKISI